MPPLGVIVPLTVLLFATIIGVAGYLIDRHIDRAERRNNRTTRT